MRRRRIRFSDPTIPTPDVLVACSELGGVRFDAFGKMNFFPNAATTFDTNMVRSGAGPSSNIPLALENLGALGRGLRAYPNPDLALHGDIDFTCNFWVKVDAAATTYYLVGQFNDAASTEDAWLFHKWSNGNFYFVTHDGVTQTDVSKSGADDTNWHMITGRRTASTNETVIYVDAVAGTPSTSNASIANVAVPYHLSCGQNGTSDSNVLDGKMAQVAIWKKALTDAQITSLYNSGSGIKVLA